MTIEQVTIEKIIRKLLAGENYRDEIISIIDAQFLDFTIDFFKKIADAKINSDKINEDWYKKVFLDPALPSREIATNAGLNLKTIHNAYNSSTKEIVITASTDHYEGLLDSINNLVDNETALDINLQLTFNNVTITLSINETLIAINALAVKRAAIRGGLWSVVGKRVETPLMKTLCHLYNVSECYYLTNQKSDKTKIQDDTTREVDFYLKNGNNAYRCEVKLMGAGNPEGADGALARNVNIFVADKLSKANKAGLDKQGISWVALRDEDGPGFRRFRNILECYKIPFEELSANYTDDLAKIFSKIFE